MRQLSVSIPPAPPGEAPSSDLGDWLTRDLRAKGSPLPSARPPAPNAEERERAELAGWLARDLKPKHSLHPERSSVLPLAPSPQDSLAPQLLPPGAHPSEAPQALASARELEEDDLAVLPGRRRKSRSGSPRKRVALAVGALLLTCAAALNWRGSGTAANFEGAASAAAPDTAAALPPPPADVPESVAPEPVPAPAPGARRSAASAEEPGLDDPRSFLDGLSVRRYADVPSPTLSRLAREQRRRARERDDAVRSTSSGPAAGSPAPAKASKASK